MATIELKVKGMHCSSCEELIKDIAENEKGVISCTANKENGKVIIETKEEIDIDNIKAQIAEENFEVEE